MPRIVSVRDCGCVLNISGAKGIGEVAMGEAAAAIVNAFYHATGRRIRHQPIRIENLV